MQTEVTEAGPFERMLTLRLDESELEAAKDSAAKKLSKSLKIKGFRPGKAPRAVVERMVGADALRREAIDDALAEFVSEAIGDTDLAPVTVPRVEDLRDGDTGGVEVDVRITLWPKVENPPDAEGRKILVEVPDVEESEIDDQIERLRNQFAELEDVSREADEGDFVVINLSVESGGRPIEEAAATDLLYEVGSRSFIPGLDGILVGSSAGDIKEGPATLPDGFGELSGENVTLRVLVKGVRAKKLPDVTDDWIADVTEFDTLSELRDELAENLQAMKLGAANAAFRERLVADLVEEVDVELPEALVEAEMEASLHNLAHGLDDQGIDLPNYLRITGQDEASFVAEVRERATRALKTRLLLEAVAESHDLAVDESEIDAAITEMAARARREPADLRAALEESGQGEVLTGDILRRKALDRLLEDASPVDADGNPVDLDIHSEDDEADASEQEPTEAGPDQAIDEAPAPDADTDNEPG